MSQCIHKIYTGQVPYWQCPRDALPSGYCEIHEPSGWYRIKFTWPDGKVRWCAGEKVTQHLSKIKLYTFAEADDIVRTKYHDARSVWGIVTSKERTSESKPTA